MYIHNLNYLICEELEEHFYFEKKMQIREKIHDVDLFNKIYNNIIHFEFSSFENIFKIIL